MLGSNPINFIRGALLFGTFLCVQSVGNAAVAETSTNIYTLDKHIVRKEIASAQFSPDGDILVYEHVPPYNELGDYGANYNIRSRFGAHLYVFEAQEGSSSRMLFPQKRGVGCWMGDFSPSGLRLAYFCLENGQVHAGVYDFHTNSTRRFQFTPYFTDWRLSSSPIWLSDDRLVYQAMPTGSQPYEVLQRRHAANLVRSRWERAWRGELSVTVLRGGASLNKPAPLEGELLLVDLEENSQETIGEGLFVDLTISSDGGTIAAFKQWTAPQPDPNEDEIGYHLGLLEPVLIDIYKKQVEPMCAYCGGVARTITWSADERRVVFFARRSNERVTEGRYFEYDVIEKNAVEYHHRGLTLSPKQGREFYHEPENGYSINGGLIVFARRLGGENEQPSFYSSSAIEEMYEVLPESEWYLLQQGGGFKALSEKVKLNSPIVLDVQEDGIFFLVDGRIVSVSDDRETSFGGDREWDLSLPLSTFNAWQMRPRLSPRPFFISETPDRSIVFADLDKGETFKLPLPDDTSRVLAASAPGRSAVTLRIGKDNLVTLTLVSEQLGEVKVLSLNRHLVGIDEPEWASLSYEYKGKSLTSCALLPPNYKPDKVYPTIVSVYPGVKPGCTSQAYREANRIGARMQGMNFHLLASQGYVVVRPTIPYDLMHGDQGPMEFLVDLVHAATDAFVNEGISDPDALGLYGFSNGGVSSLWVLTQSNRFKTAVVGNSWVNASSHYANNGRHSLLSGFPEFDRHSASVNQYEPGDSWPFSMGGKLWDQTERYIKNSPLFFADRIDVPLLMYHSDLDSGFPRGEFDQLFTALYRLGKDVEYLHYWGEGHGPNSPKNMVHLWERKFDWYETHLKSSAE